MDRDAEGTAGTLPGAGRARRPRPGHARPGSGAGPRFLFRPARSRAGVRTRRLGPWPRPLPRHRLGAVPPPHSRAAKLQAAPGRASVGSAPAGLGPFPAGATRVRGPRLPARDTAGGGAGSVSRHPSRGCRTWTLAGACSDCPQSHLLPNLCPRGVTLFLSRGLGAFGPPACKAERWCPALGPSFHPPLCQLGRLTT